MKTISFCRAMHAPLYERYDLRGGFKFVGDSDGPYGRMDSKTGAEFWCLESGRKGNKVLVSKDMKAGYFYPENTFIWGHDENDEPLVHEEIEAICKALRLGNTRRVILPNGFAKGELTWFNAITFSPIERQPFWLSLPGIIKQQFNVSDSELEINQNYVLFFKDEKINSA